MGFRINTNTAALNAHNQATVNNRSLDQSLSRLSSGLRINNAADDASGLAIANSLKAQASGLGQAISNGNDAIGLVKTADGALDEYGKILDKIKTKATQAASDGQNSTTRLSIQKDIDKLMEELNMIAKTTSFNGQKLLSGSYTNKEFQVGASSNESVKLNIASTETNKIGHTTRTTLDVANPGGGNVQLNMTSALTGQEISLKGVDVNFTNDPQKGMGALADEINKYTDDTGIKARAVVETTTAAISSGETGSFSINGVAINSVIVEKNDNSGSLVSAINSKTVETGVVATMNNDGSMKLESNDGRSIKVEGETSAVFGKSDSELSTLGHLELSQIGASDFKIENKSVGALSFDMNITGATTTGEDSVLAAGSTLATGSVLAQGSTTGGETTVDGATTSVDSLITAGSQLADASIIEEGTTVGGKFSNTDALTLSSDMLLTKGSVLATGSILASGTTVTTAFNTATDVFQVGQVLDSAVTTESDLTLNDDMTLKTHSDPAQSSQVAAATTINVGSKLGADTTASGGMTTTKDMVLEAGSQITAGSILAAGSIAGADLSTTADTTLTEDSKLISGSQIADASIVAEGSTLGGSFTATGDEVLAGDMAISKGSTIGSGSILKAGTVLTFATDAAETGVAYEAGTTLKTDLTLSADMTVDTDMVLLEGSTMEANTQFTANTGKNGTINMGETTNSSLADISVLTMEDAQKAIDTLDAAITQLDTIRSDLGSVQNQLTSTINNISVTQVNVQAAESQLRDVDFAAESANFSKHNILSQSGAYAMSQANAVQQNVLRLLQ